MFRRRRDKAADEAAATAAAGPSTITAAAATPPASSPTSLASSSSSSAADASSPLGALGLPSASEWPQFPVYVRLSPRPLPGTDAAPPPPSAAAPPPAPGPQQQRRDGQPLGAAVPFNTLQRVPFESELFEGEIVLNMAGLSPAPPASFDTHGCGYFTGCAEGKTLECAVQGRFKRRLRFDEVYTGQSFTTPLQRLPPRFLVRAVEAVVRRLAPATQLDVTGDRPFIMGPLATVAGVMRVSDPSKGDPVPDIMTLCEDTAALGGPFTPTPPPSQPPRRRRSGSFGANSGGGGGWFGRRLTAGAWGDGGEGGKGVSLPLHRDRAARRKFFADAGRLRTLYFEPGLVYGFGFFGSAWRVDAWQLSVAGVASIDLATYVHPTQALQIMARLKERDELLWALEVWHAKALLPPDALAAAAAARRDGKQPPDSGAADAAAAAAVEGDAEAASSSLAGAVEGLTLQHGAEGDGGAAVEEGEGEEQEQTGPLQRLAGLFSSPSPRKGSK